jgi:hypothetical protein
MDSKVAAADWIAELRLARVVSKDGRRGRSF